MTEERIEEIRKSLDGRNGWEVAQYGTPDRVLRHVALAAYHPVCYCDGDEEMASFIASAPATIRDLLAEVDRLRRPS